MTHTKTRSVCVLCLKRFGGGSFGDEAAGAYQSRVLVPYIGLNQQVPLTDDGGQRRHDLYSKFLLFTSRYFKISASESFLQFARDHKATTGESVQAFCEDCQVLVSHVVDLYAELQAVKLHLLKKVEDLENLTRLSTRRISPKMSRGLVKTATEQLNIKSVRQLELYRKSLILCCKRKIKGTSPKVLVPRGLFPDYWKYTYTATQTSLIRLITVFALASSRLIWKPKEEKKPGSILKALCNRRPGGPLSRRKVAFADIQNHFKEATAKVKSEGALVKREAGAVGEDENSFNAADGDDDDDVGFPDTGADDNDSDWSRGAASPSGSLEGSDVNLNSELEEDGVPTKRRRLRRRRSSGNTKADHNSESDEDFDPNDSEFGSKSSSRKRGSSKCRSSLDKDATVPCKICDKLFIDRRGLSKHMMKIHNTSLGYSCDVCGLKLNTNLEYATHKRTAHKIRRGGPRGPRQSFGRILRGPKYRQKYVYRPPVEKENATLPCTKCNRKFVDGRGHSRHMIKMHKSHIDYTCVKCGHKSKTALEHMQHKSQFHRSRRGPRGFITVETPKEGETNCKQCEIEFSTPAEFLEHDKTVHNNTQTQCRFECPMCMKRTTNETMFQRHLLSHEMDSSLLRLFHCEVCGKTFPREGQLSDHFVTVHDGVYACSMCEAKYPSAKSLRVHLETHETDQKNYFCNFCYRSYTNEQFWKVHSKSAHVGKERIFCDQDQCAGEFNTVQELNEHLKIHIEEMGSESTKASNEVDVVENGQQPEEVSLEIDKKPVAVAVTTEISKGGDDDTPTDQNEHHQIHTCTICGWGFLNKKTFNNHHLVHIPYIKEDGGYTCPFKDCSKVVRMKDVLIAHYIRVHGEKEVPYKCHECQAQYSQFFWYKTHLKLHEERKSGRKFTCETCNEECQDSVHLNVHRRTHRPRLMTLDKYGDPSSPMSGDEGMGLKKRYPRGTGKPRGRPRRHPKTEEELAKEREEEEQLNCSCVVCERACKNGYELRKHLEKRHENEMAEEDKPIQCNFCNFKFIHMQTYKLHVTSIHMQKYKFVCDADRCDGVFGDCLLLNEHLKQVHLDATLPASDAVVEGEDGNVTENVVANEETPKDFDGDPTPSPVPEKSNEGVVKVKELTYCKICNWGFTSAYYAQLHELCHIPIVGRAYPCPSCCSSFSSIGKLTFHYNKTHGKNLKPFKCLECPGRFYSKAGLKVHCYRHDRRRNLDPNQKIVCIECDREFLDNFLYKIHMKVHDPKSHLVCPEGCGERFVDKTRMGDHLKRKHGQGERYPCPICGVAFIYEYETRKHMEWVHEPPKYECEVCKKKYRRPGALKRHLETHEPEGPQGYICSECGKPFRSVEGMKYHMASIHTPDHMKKYSCPYCTYKSHRRLLWKNHLVTCTKTKGIPYDVEKFGKPPVVNKPKPTGRPPGRPAGFSGGGGGRRRIRRAKKKEESSDEEEEMEEKTTTEEEEEDDDNETEEKAEVEVEEKPELETQHQMPQLTPSSSNNPMINAIIANITGIPEIANISEDPTPIQTRGKRGRKKKETSAPAPSTSTIDQMLFQSMSQQQQQSSQPSVPTFPQLFGSNHGNTQYQSWLNTTTASAGPSSSFSQSFPQQHYHQSLINSLSNSHHSNDSSGTPSPHMMQHQQMYSPNHVYSPPLPDQPQNLQYSDRRK